MVIEQTSQKSQQLNISQATAILNINSGTRVWAVFIVNDANNDVVEEHIVFDDNLEEEKEKRKRGKIELATILPLPETHSKTM